MKHLLFIPLLLLSLIASSSWAQDFDKGLDAYAKDDYATALREWTPLAQQGNARAQYNLGWMYYYGEGVLQDDNISVKWFRLAAEQGDASAQSMLGGAYEDGKGVPQDYKAAVEWYRLAAEQGHAGAQLNLGYMYSRGNGVPQDYLYAHMWGNITASNGHEYGGDIRDEVAEKMTPAGIFAAQTLARECVVKDYKGC